MGKWVYKHSLGTDGVKALQKFAKSTHYNDYDRFFNSIDSIADGRPSRWGRDDLAKILAIHL